MTTMTALVLLNLRSTFQRAGSFTRTRLLQTSRTYFCKRRQILTHIPKVTLFCLGAVNASCCSAKCQEAILPQRPPERKFLAKVQVHRLVFLFRITLRALVLLLKFGPLLLLSPLVLLSSRWAGCWLDALLWVTETSGPTFIKLGQWASTRRDIFSPEFCDRFSRLHVKVRPHPWQHTKQCLRRAFGEGWRRVLEFESKEPVGSGCVAQVYRGWARADHVDDPAFQSLLEELEKEDLLEAWEIPGLGGVVSSLWQLWKGGKEEEVHPTVLHEESSADKGHLIPVAIKVEIKVDITDHNLLFSAWCPTTNVPAWLSFVFQVIHPGVRRQVEIDLLLMKAGSWLLQCLPGMKWLSLCEVVEEFEKLMTKQVGTYRL